jgi:SAM-dependent methyltransferase
MPKSDGPATRLREVLSSEAFIDASLSAPAQSGADAVRRVEVRPVTVRGKRMVQFAYRTSTQITHRNIPPVEAASHFLELLATDFRSASIRSTERVFHVTVTASGDLSIRQGSQASSPVAATHDRAKRYVIPEGAPCAFLQRLGVMTEAGRVIAAKQAKFRQINRYLEMVADVIRALPATGPLRVIDFGSGKSYLTFALHHFMHAVLEREVSITGLDLKREVIAECEEIARDLDAEGLSFEVGDIAGYAPNTPIDMVVSLHACDTATDDALERAVEWGARVILAAPCCQHELARQIASDAMRPILKHGILRERLAAIVTDALRAQRLEMAGYKVQVLEFIETEHTPKNLLIRAVKRPGSHPNTNATYEAFKAFWNVDPHIDHAMALKSDHSS